MINPEIRKEYGDSGFTIMENIVDKLTDEERDSIYAVGHHFTSEISGMPHHVNSDRPDLVDSICKKLVDYTLSIDDDNTVLICTNKTHAEGVKICLTT